MKNKQADILEFSLSPLAKGGLIIKDMANAVNVAEHDHSRPHRDDHYLILVIINGSLVISIDFEHRAVNAPAMIMVKPGQIHHMVSSEQVSGWGVSSDSALIDLEFQSIFEKKFNHPLLLDPASLFYNHAVILLKQMEKIQSSGASMFEIRVTHSILKALVALTAGEIISSNPEEETKTNRRVLIAQGFTDLLKTNFKEWKQPAKYASALNISVAHLYDTIKSVTGNSVTSCIQNHCILEAKGLLCFSKLTVREVAYQIGYEEPVYFGKLFKKITGSTPLQFRKQYND